MNSATLYTVLKSDIEEEFGATIYARPYSESTADTTLGLTLHFYLESVESPAGGESIKDRDETASFKIDVNSTQLNADLSEVLTTIERLKSVILNAETCDYVESLATSRDETNTDNITYTLELTYNYLERYG